MNVYTSNSAYVFMVEGPKFDGALNSMGVRIYSYLALHREIYSNNSTDSRSQYDARAHFP
jgi:hypothetical protein